MTDESKINEVISRYQKGILTVDGFWSELNRVYKEQQSAPDLPEKTKRAIVACEELERMLNEGCTIKAQRTGGVRIGKDCAPIQGLYITGPKEAPDLPPLPEKDLVVLPVEFVKPEGFIYFSGWTAWKDGREKTWEFSDQLTGNFIGDLRYAVKPDTEIARLNGVGFGPCPGPHGWHNPRGLTPEQVGVPEYRLLCRDEVGCRETSDHGIEIWKHYADRPKWDKAAMGHHATKTYRTAAPYGSLPPVIEHTFPECAGESNGNKFEGGEVRIAKPEGTKLGECHGNKVLNDTYGHDLDGNLIEPLDDDREVIPEGTRVHEGEVTHVYLDGRWKPWVMEEIPCGETTRLMSSGNIRAYARKKYSALHAESGIKPGDVVEVTRAADDKERGWGLYWSPLMNPCIGNRYEVLADNGIKGFSLQNEEGKLVGFFPAFVLRKVPERRKVPLEASDWGGGPWTVRKISHPEDERLIIGVNKDGPVIPSAKIRLPPKEMKDDYERARGWPGDPDLQWEGCFKWADESEG